MSNIFSKRALSIATEIPQIRSIFPFPCGVYGGEFQNAIVHKLIRNVLSTSNQKLKCPGFRNCSNIFKSSSPVLHKIDPWEMTESIYNSNDNGHQEFRENFFLRHLYAQFPIYSSHLWYNPWEQAVFSTSSIHKHSNTQFLNNLFSYPQQILADVSNRKTLVPSFHAAFVNCQN